MAENDLAASGGVDMETDKPCTSHYWVVQKDGNGECKYCGAKQHFEPDESFIGIRVDDSEASKKASVESTNIHAPERKKGDQKCPYCPKRRKRLYTALGLKRHITKRHPEHKEDQQDDVGNDSHFSKYPRMTLAEEKQIIAYLKKNPTEFLQSVADRFGRGKSLIQRLSIEAGIVRHRGGAKTKHEPDQTDGKVDRNFDQHSIHISGSRAFVMELLDRLSKGR